MRRTVLIVGVVALAFLPEAGRAATAPAHEAQPHTHVIVVLDGVPRSGGPAASADAVGGVVDRAGGRVVRRYSTLPYLAVEVPAPAADVLARTPGVRAVVPDSLMSIALGESTPLVGAPPAHAVGANGAGTAIAVLDTGIDKAHPFLAGKVVDEACFAATTTCPNGQTTQVGPGAGVPCTYALSACRHGTHVAGIAAGGPAPGVSFTGVAPGAKIISVQVFSRFDDPICSSLGQSESPCALARNSDMLAGLEHVLEVADDFDVASVNISIGGLVRTGPCDGHVLKPAIDNLRAVGVATVIAAGNNGATNGITEPGCISSAVSVGATTEADTVASYSNSASFMKLWAPGSSIRSSVPGNGYATFNGTSMSTPHVAGAFALARQLLPDLTLAQVQQRLQTVGPAVTDPRNGVTKRRLDILRALRPTQIVPGGAGAPEGDPIVIPVTLSRPSWFTVTAHYETVSVDATQGADFVGTSGTITFPGLTTTASVTIWGIEDTVDEPIEYFAVVFSAPQNAVLGGFYGLGIGAIVDDD